MYKTNSFDEKKFDFPRNYKETALLITAFYWFYMALISAFEGNKENWLGDKNEEYWAKLNALLQKLEENYFFLHILFENLLLDKNFCLWI